MAKKLETFTISIDLKGLRESYHAIVKIITNLMKKEKKKDA